MIQSSHSHGIAGGNVDNFNDIHAAYNYLMQIQVGSMVSVCFAVVVVLPYFEIDPLIFRCPDISR